VGEEFAIDLTEIAEKEIVERVTWERYGLKENPFPAAAIARRSQLFFGTMNKFRFEIFQQIARKIVQTARTGRYLGIVIRGEFGLGKTHTLYYFSDLINRQLANVENMKSRAIYLKSPGHDLNEFLGNFIDEIDPDELLSYLYIASREKIDSLFKDSWEKGKKIDYTKDPDGFQETLNTGDSLDIIRKVATILTEEGFFSHQDFALCLSVLMLSNNPEYQRIANVFVHGSRVTKAEVKKLGLSSVSLTTADIYKRVFPDILGLLKKQEKYNMVFVFVDEFEKIVKGLTPRSRFEFLEDLRALIDSNLVRFSLVLGCSTEAYDKITETSGAFADRNREIFDLPRIRKATTTMELIEPYLRSTRIASFGKRSIFPFTISALKIVAEKEDGSPRKILEACHDLLDYGITMGLRSLSKPSILRWYGARIE